MTSRARLVLSNHRQESVELARQLMMQHDTVILEEAPEEGFEEMLAGRISTDSYLESLDMEYPDFSRAMCRMLRGFYGSGKKIYQIEPFMENLIEIHRRFADGWRPEDLESGTVMHWVYLAERSATGALIRFYETSLQADFDATVEAVKRFARADAARFDLRNRLRSEAIAAVLSGGGDFYIEAGQIHYPLWRELKNRLPASYQLKVTFLMADAVRQMNYRGHLYGPGDILTLLYRFHPHKRLPSEDILAARALIYVKLILKDEIPPVKEQYPHTRDEIEVAEITKQLSYDDCRHLYPLIFRSPVAEARQKVQNYIDHDLIGRCA
jgi:hypothetical protein